MSSAGWYPDPGGQQGLFRYWDGHAWSAATSPNPNAAPPTPGLSQSAPQQPGGSQPLGQRASGQPGQGQPGQGQPGQGQPGQGQPGQGQPGQGQPGHVQQPYAQQAYAAQTKRKSPVGWWIGGAALLLVIIVVGVLAIRFVGGGGSVGGPGAGQASQDVCPEQQDETAAPQNPADGRVHGGPLSYPQLGSPWSAPQTDDRVPFGRDVQSQNVTVQKSYQPGKNWVASVLVGELQAGDGFFTPEQGSAVVVKCILGKFYGDNEVQRDDKVNKKTTVDGHDAWLVESQLSFDIKGLKTRGELLIVVIVATGATAGLYYASIPNTTPELVAPARKAMKELKVDA